MCIICTHNNVTKERMYNKYWREIEAKEADEVEKENEE